MSSARFSRPRRRNLVSVNSAREPVKLTPQEQSSSAYRLSKANAKFNQNKAIEQGLNRTYMESYYLKHPDEHVDKRPIKEKYKELQKAFENTTLDENQRLNLLVQEKALNLIQYGENSHQSFLSFINIGVCYNRLNKQISAIRNLEKAKELEKVANATPGEKQLVAIETTEAYLVLFSNSVRANKTDDANKYIRNAYSTIRPFQDSSIEDPELYFRKSLAVAHIYHIKQMYKDAIQYFEEGIKAFSELYPDVSESHAHLHVEAAENAEYVGDGDDYAVHVKFSNYRKAYDIFKQLGMEEEAKEIEPKLPKEGEYTETEPPQETEKEEEDYYEEEDFGEEETAYYTENTETQPYTTDQYYTTDTYQTQDYKSYQYKIPSQSNEEETHREEESQFEKQSEGENRDLPKDEENNENNEGSEQKENNDDEENNDNEENEQKDDNENDNFEQKEESGQDDFEQKEEGSQEDFESKGESNQGDFESGENNQEENHDNQKKEEEDDFEDDFA